MRLMGEKQPRPRRTKALRVPLSEREHAVLVEIAASQGVSMSAALRQVLYSVGAPQR
jgi:hypothetical protein